MKQLFLLLAVFVTTEAFANHYNCRLQNKDPFFGTSSLSGSFSESRDFKGSPKMGDMDYFIGIVDTAGFEDPEDFEIKAILKDGSPFGEPQWKTVTTYPIGIERIELEYSFFERNAKNPIQGVIQCKEGPEAA